MEVRGRRSRDMSPERVKVCTQPRLIRPTFKKVQVVYYLTRNGQLEHPHYMEVTHFANQQLRLKDVIDRLTVLRGKGMPSMYSWSCKRSYKNGYVWNDLAEHDIINPSEGAEYVLKGSELVIDGCTEKFQQLQVGSTQQFQQLSLGNTLRLRVVESTNFHPKRMPQDHVHQEVHQNNEYEEDNEADQENNDQEVEELDQEECEEKISCYTTSTTAHYSRCSRGVSTDELHHHQQQQHQLQQQKQESRETMKNPRSEFNLENESPPSTTSSSLSDKAINENNNISKRFEDGDPVANEPLLTRNSMLFQLIACGGSLSFRGSNKHVPVLKQQPATTTTTLAARRSNCSDLHKGVLCKSAVVGSKVAVAVAVEEEVDEIKYMSENPRFGNLQAEEKEFFSGSILESMATDERTQVEPSSLKKSSSYNEERSSKLAAVETEVIEEVKREKALKGKCIPRKKSSSKQSKK